MANTQVDTLLFLLDQCYNRPAWHGPNLNASIRGVGAKQAGWRPQPGRHSIAEQAVHAAYWKYVVRRRLRGEKRGSFPLEGSNWFLLPDKLTERAWNDYQQLLAEQHTLLRQAVAGLGGGRRTALTKDQLRRISGIAAHDVYHAGQIRLLRALYEGRA